MPFFANVLSLGCQQLTLPMGSHRVAIVQHGACNPLPTSFRMIRHCWDFVPPPQRVLINTCCSERVGFLIESAVTELTFNYWDLCSDSTSETLRPDSHTYYMYTVHLQCKKQDHGSAMRKSSQCGLQFVWVKLCYGYEHCLDHQITPNNKIVLAAAVRLSGSKSYPPWRCPNLCLWVWQVLSRAHIQCQCHDATWISGCCSIEPGVWGTGMRTTRSPLSAGASSLRRRACKCLWACEYLQVNRRWKPLGEKSGLAHVAGRHLITPLSPASAPLHHDLVTSLNTVPKATTLRLESKAKSSPNHGWTAPGTAPGGGANCSIAAHNAVDLSDRDRACGHELHTSDPVEPT